MTSMEVVQRGEKSFWKAKCHIKIIIVEHNDLDVLEVVCFDPVTFQEAPRLYLCRSLLVTNIYDDEIDFRIDEMKAQIIRRHGSVDNAQILKQVWQNAIYDYIDERLEIHKRLAGSKAFHIEFRKPLFSEGPDQKLLTCPKPPTLVPYPMLNFTPAKEGHIEIRKVPVIHNDQLTKREMWRIPVVFVKMAKGRGLGIRDAKIWRVVVRKILSEDETQQRAIGDMVSLAQCADFARVRIEPTAAVPKREIMRPPAINTSAPTHRTLYEPEHSKNRFTHPTPTRTNSFLVGLDAITSSLQRRLASISSPVNTANKQYRAAAAADLETEEAKTRMHTHHGHTSNTPTGTASVQSAGTPHSIDSHGRSSSTASCETPISARGVHSTPRRDGRRHSHTPHRHSITTPRSTPTTPLGLHHSPHHHSPHHLGLTLGTNIPSPKRSHQPSDHFVARIAKGLTDLNDFVSSGFSSKKYRNKVAAVSLDTEKVAAEKELDCKALDDVSVDADVCSVPDDTSAQLPVDTGLPVGHCGDGGDDAATEEEGSPGGNARHTSAQKLSPHPELGCELLVTAGEGAAGCGSSDGPAVSTTLSPAPGHVHPHPRTASSASAGKGGKGGVDKTDPHPHPHHHSHSHPVAATKPHFAAPIGVIAPAGPAKKFFQLITVRGRNVVVRPVANVTHDTVQHYE